MTTTEEFIVEVAPGHLEFVARCQDDELVSAALLLLIADDEPDSVWVGRFQVVAAAVEERFRQAPPAEPLRLLVDAMARLPFPVRQRVGLRLREGIEAATET